MDQLPSSIEAYLEEAGFSGTEILILRRLMDDEPLTIRQLGAKTGKSTGVLDQAMKKLMKKNIIKKTLINDSPKYSLDSMESVVEWMQDDMEQKRDMLLRRHQNFESFVTSLESGNKRPDIEYFEGESGIKQAYIKLLNGPGEIFHYLPVTGKEEEDPLRDFRVQYFRERQNRKMFSRILAHDNALGRRYQSRDAFEYRKTVLVPEAEYPFTFEKIITGDRIACFDHKAKTACVIRYPELADIEKTLFEAIWRQVQVAAATTKEEMQKVLTETAPETISTTTVTMSQVREFFLSRRSVATFSFIALLSLATTYVLSVHNANLAMDRIQERVKSIAATAALQFDSVDIEKIRTVQDAKKSEYSKLVHHLNRIRRENEGVTFAYILRPAGASHVWSFVADADAMNPYEIRDVDGDGKINDSDDLSIPGEIYAENLQNGDPFTLSEASSYIPTTDKWGTHITGTAPIVDVNGRPIAILGIDIETSYWKQVSQSTFWPILSFIGFFLLFVSVRIAAYNKAFFVEIGEILAKRRASIFLLTCAFVTAALTLVLYIRSINQRTEEARARIATIAAAGSIEFSFDQLNNLRTIDDVSRPEYATVVQELHEIRGHNKAIRYAYLIRPVADSTTFSFIADADALGRDVRNDDDTNGDGIVDGSDEIGYPGLSYDISHIDVLREGLYNTPITSREPYIDKWGFVFTGYAPIRDSSESIVALLAIDVDAMNVYLPSFTALLPIILFIVFFVGYLILRSGMRFPLIASVLRTSSARNVLYAVVFALMIAYWIGFALIHYQRNFVQEETGRRLMAIAATAASQFDPKDLDKLRFASDMKTPEYQRVFKKLNEIRDSNPEIKWIYIIRPTENHGIWEFVADADANFFLEEYTDFDVNSVPSPNEINVWPGSKYFYDWDIFTIALKNSSFTKYPETDQWGTYITGAAPILLNGEAVAVLGVDIDFSK